MDEVLGLRGDGREFRGEDEVLAPVHDLVVGLCGWRRGRGGEGRGERGGERGEEEEIGGDGRGGEGSRQEYESTSVLYVIVTTCSQ